MSLKKRILFSLVLYFSLYEFTFSDDCVPNGVPSIRIYANATLIWKVLQEEHCNITQFHITVGKNESITYSYNVTDTFLDLSFLEACELWDFTVIPMSDGVLGFGRTLTEYVPVPPNADLSLSHFDVSYRGGREVFFDYALADDTHGDCTINYRLTALNKELGTTQDIFVDKYPSSIDFLSPCASYQFTIRAYNSVEKILEGPQLIVSDFAINPQPQIAPRVYSIKSGTKSFKITFVLESTTNMCPLRTLYLDGGQYFNYSVPVQNSLDGQYLVEVEVSSLNPSSMYNFRAYVENSAGLSPPIVLSVQTLDSI